MLSAVCVYLDQTKETHFRIGCLQQLVDFVENHTVSGISVRLLTSSKRVLDFRLVTPPMVWVQAWCIAEFSGGLTKPVTTSFPSD